MVWVLLVAGNIALSVFMRRFRNRPFRTQCAGIALTVHPGEHKVVCASLPTSEQLAEISAWVSNWKGVLKSRPYVTL